MAKRAILCILRWLYLGFITIISVGPLVWIILSSFKTNSEILSDTLSLPSNWSFNGYSEALRISPIFKFYINSVIVSFGSTLLCVFVVSMAAYVLARFDFKGKNLLTLLLASSLLVPISALLMPIYTLIRNIGLYDTKTGLIIVYAAIGLPTTLFIMKSFFLGIPRTIEESAYLDGASFMRTFISIVLPMAKSGLATAATLQFLMSWNEFLFALIITGSSKARTLPLSLGYFVAQFSFNYTALFAALVMVILPSVVIYVVLQEQVTGSLVAGSVKG